MLKILFYLLKKFVSHPLKDGLPQLSTRENNHEQVGSRIKIKTDLLEIDFLLQFMSRFYNLQQIHKQELNKSIKVIH